MGIKGIYGEIGPGERVALSKLAIENLEQTGRPLRVAIDVSIWQFQIQSAQGGSNPAIRTLYYRLLRLLSVSVHPLFVFDGPHKPPVKRNKRSGHQGASVPNLMTKQLLSLFGFPFHMAPGEAEAECALLQREGIVDAVLSEDVDTLMFGCGLTLRNWSSEGSRGSKSPTHVSVYDAKATKEGKSGLDREGMVLVALMSGGDYVTEGIPGCGIKVACEAARAGFGESLCRISRSNKAGLESWRKTLSHEIQTNESNYFRVKHKALKIPENFPDKDVLGYYTHPVVSSASKIAKLKEDISWDGAINIPGLRDFVAEAFEWTHKIGAKKFIRGLAPVLLVHKLLLRGNRRASGYDDVVLTAMMEMQVVRSICGRRTHFSTDGVPELRVVYHPAEIVGLDLNAEKDDNEDYGRDGLAPIYDDDQIEEYASDDAEQQSRSASPSKRGASTYDPTQLDKFWICETIAKIGIPLKVEDYEESLRNPKRTIKPKPIIKKMTTKGGMPKGAMEKFVEMSKPGFDEAGETNPKVSRKTRHWSKELSLPPVFLAPTVGDISFSQPASTGETSVASQKPRQTRSAALTGAPTNKPASTRTMRSETSIKSKTSRKADSRPIPNANPWTLATSSPSQSCPTVTKHIGQEPKGSRPPKLRNPQKCSIDINSTPVPSLPSSSPPPSNPMSRKHTRSPQPESDLEPKTLVTVPRGEQLIEQQLLVPAGDEKDRDLPSSQKKRSPQSTAMTFSPDLPPSLHGRREILTPEPVNRKIGFSSQELRARSSSPSFPAMEDRFSAKDSANIEPTVQEIIEIPSSPEAPRSQTVVVSPLKQKGKGSTSNGKKYILLRESLPGAWKEADESELIRGRSRAWRQSQVECLDLTAD